jgi:multiple sugar transport system permease protein
MQLFKGLPTDLEAKVDGCGHFRTFVRVMTPNVKPGFVTVFLFSLVWHWNDYAFTGFFFRSRHMYPISVHLSNVVNMYDPTFNRLDSFAVTYDLGKVRFAACFLTMLPILIVFVFAQRYFVESIDGSILKG